MEDTTDKWAGLYRLAGVESGGRAWVRSPDGRLCYTATDARDAQLFAEQCNVFVLQRRAWSNVELDREAIDPRASSCPHCGRLPDAGHAPGCPRSDQTRPGQG
jgi:hypothetical protein